MTSVIGVRTPTDYEPSLSIKSMTWVLGGYGHFARNVNSINRLRCPWCPYIDTNPSIGTDTHGLRTEFPNEINDLAATDTLTKTSTKSRTYDYGHPLY